MEEESLESQLANKVVLNSEVAKAAVSRLTVKLQYI